ncbi:L,D-transpeptidase family protein [Legionella quateirensis]|uniref:ErfK/YbiS/YcfS/YnhG family protein n=1 Tax=Legionella quateirensis TaxID=45072 RepID=A0A378L0X8_9GAMM|nr:L,D-transpeptidase family protein [Legionella quateirensis]KTD51004.1 putative ErfK/YbiS/YcfS/YnhG family protein precursor [Legionella quateirensis]STY17750.1 putative ErfK/YbiS/YcfS/YnhG family protein precursor [Legionella quateirensis]
MLNKKFISIIFSLIALSGNSSNAETFVLPAAGDVVGQIQYSYSKIDESIDEVGRRFNVGYYEMVRANPLADPVHSLPEHTRLIIPSQYILPDVPRRGIVINLAEYRLYYFPDDENVVITFPVGIGKEGWNTPLGLTRITSKVVNPIWRPTAKVRAAAEEIGAPLPELFPAGADNPLGKHVLRLGWPTFLIHGTNRADGVGARVSAGCIRMLPADIEHLYELVSIGTPVRVINEPVKIGTLDGMIYIQVQPPLKGQANSSLKRLTEALLIKNNQLQLSTNQVIQNELSKPTGIVKQISRG